jgi:serine/threonine-protein kinase
MSAGTIIAGKYRLDSLLGRGGMGAVWRAHDIDLNAPVAVKLLDPLLAASGDGLARFHREAEAAAALRSPHVVQIIARGVDETTRQPYIVMELMEGQSLADRLEREGKLSPGLTAQVLSQVSRALARAHEAGVVHRDLKPDNIFLVRNDDEDVAKVLDFGIAKSDKHRLGNDSETRTGAVMGTPYYMSPEQISSSKGVDFRTDLWAFGVIACECITGRRPFDADTYGGLTLRICAEPIPRPSELGPVPPGFDAWFARAVARDPSSRFASAREAADELRKACGESAVSPVPGAGSSEPPRNAHPQSTAALSRTANDGLASRRPSLGWTFAAVAAAIAAVAGGVLWLARGEDVVEAPAASSAPAGPSSAATATATAPAPPPAPLGVTVAEPAAAAPSQAVPPSNVARSAKPTSKPVSKPAPTARAVTSPPAAAQPVPAPTPAVEVKVAPARTQASKPPPAPPSEESAIGSRK